MSHTVTIAVNFRDPEALRAACAEMQVPFAERETVTFHDGATHTGMTVRLPEWQYPIVITNPTTVAMDDYNGKWGDRKHLTQLKRLYAAHAAVRSLQRQGYTSVRRVVLENNHIEVVAR